MNVLNDNWLDGLLKHPIFEVNTELLELTRKIIATQTRQYADNEDFSLQHHGQLITLRDNDLFVAVGSEVRVLNLTACKNNWMKQTQETGYNWIKSTPYFVLNTPEINFSVESLTVNKNGRLLAVKGYSKLVIVCLPRQGFSNYSEPLEQGKKFICRTLSVGSSYYDTNKSEILKVEWHPLSETRTHIVVLGNDNFLRIFDISMDIEEPEQCFDLSPVQQKTPDQKNKSKIGFSFDDEDNSDEDAVSFSLGGASKDTSGWESFTVFYSLRNGHMYALCPVIPNRSSFRRSHLDSLLCVSYAKFERTKNGETEDDETLAYLYQLQTNWLSAVLRSSKISQTADTVTVTNSNTGFPVQRQGPFFVDQPVSIELGTEATDILYINLTPLAIIALAFTDGTIHNYIIGGEIDAQWQMPMHNPKDAFQERLGYLLSDSSFLPVASLYETFSVHSPASPKYQSMVLTQDPLYEDTYYVYHTAGVHAVSMNSWAETLCKITSSYESGQSEESKMALEQWLKEKATSEIRLLVDSSPFSDGFVPITGLAVITDMYLSYSVLSLTVNYQMVIRDLYIRRDPASNKASQDAIKQQLKHLQSDDTSGSSEGYQSLLPLPAYQPPAQLGTLPKQPKIVVPASMNGTKEIVINEETLRFFSKSAIDVRREARDIMKIARNIDDRLMIQQKEFERQIKSLRDLYVRLQKVKSPNAKTAQEKKLEEICEKHVQLRIRLDIQLRTLMQTYQPELSNEEKNWIAKLEKIQDKVSGETGYNARVDLLKSQIREMEPSGINREKLKHLNPTQLKTILRTLQQQSLTIDKVEQRLKGCETQVSLPAA